MVQALLRFSETEADIGYLPFETDHYYRRGEVYHPRELLLASGNIHRERAPDMGLRPANSQADSMSPS